MKMKLSHPFLVSVVIITSAEGFYISQIHRIHRIPTLDPAIRSRHATVCIHSKPQDDYDDSLRGLLNELISRGIEFSPTALKEELQQLLRQDDADDGFDLGKDDLKTRQQRRERRRSSGQSYVDDYYNDIDMEGEDEFENLSPRERRRRRQQATATFLRDYNMDGIPDKMVRVGAKATKIATSKTKQAWKNLMEMTYDDKFEDYEAPPAQQRPSPRRRPTRPSSRFETRARASSRRRPEPKVTSYRPHPRDEKVRDGSSTSAHQTASTVDFKDDGKTEASSRFETRARASSRRRPEPKVTNYRPQPRDEKVRDGSPTSAHQTASTVDLKDDGKTEATTTNISESTTATPKRSIKDILKELDDLSISYSAGVSRKDLEDLLAHHYETARTSSSPPDISSAFLYPDEENKDDDDDDKASWKGLWEKTSKVASKKVKSIPRRIVTKTEKTAQTAKDILSRQAVSSFLEDNSSSVQEEQEQDINLIMDAVIEDFSRDQAMLEERVVEAEPIPPEEWNAKARTAPRSRVAEPRRRRRRPAPRRRRRAEFQEDIPYPSRYGDGSDASEDTLFQLPPAEKPATTEARSRRRGTDTNRRQPRRVYSPYTKGQDGYDYYDDMEDVYKDGVDNMGHFMVNAVDSFLWGRASSSYRPSQRRRTHKRSGHWKDRMEEQFDQFMGIHEDGKYYDRWANQDWEENENATGKDAVSYARGRAPKRGRRTKPVWEENGSLLSVLFGTGKDARRKNSHLYDSSSILGIGGGGGSVLRLTRSVIQSGTILAGSLGRWASVRGSLPQPVIMVSIFSAVLSARPGRRLQTVVLATLVLRMLGEVLHGYADDDLDFEDDRTEEFEEEEDLEGEESTFEDNV
jgi:hypothetical protein